MTLLWPTNDTRRQPWQTFAPPLHIWPLLLSQTTLVKQDDQRSENQDLGPRKRGAFSFITQTFAIESWHSLISHGFSQLWSGEGTGECQRFSTFGLIFICHSSSPLSSDGKKNWSLWHIRSPAPLEQVFLVVIFRKEGEIDLFDIFLGAPPGILPSQPLSMYISILARWTYNLSVWVILHKYQPRSYCYLHIPTSHFSLLFKSRVCYFQIFLWLNLIIEDFSEELTLNSRVYIRTNISGENILNWFTNQFPNKGNFSLFQIFSSALSSHVSKCGGGVFLMNGQTHKRAWQIQLIEVNTWVQGNECELWTNIGQIIIHITYITYAPLNGVAVDKITIAEHYCHGFTLGAQTMLLWP